MLPTAPSFLTTKDVADYLGVSRKTVDNLRLDGVIPHYKSPGAARVRFLAEDIEAYLAACRSEATSGPLAEAVGQ